MVITGGRTSYYLIKELKKKNIKVVLIDKSKNCFSRNEADKFYQISCTNFQKIFKIAKSLKPNFFVAYTSNMNVHKVVSKISNILKKKYVSLKDLEIISCKKKQKKFYNHYKISTPSKINLKNKVKFPIIFKSNHGVGSYGVQIINSLTQLKRHKEKNNIKGFYEEFIKGSLYHIDGLSSDNNYKILQIVKKKIKSYNGIPLTHGYEILNQKNKTHIMNIVKNEIKKIFCNLKIKRNFWGVDFIIKDNKAYFIEFGILHDCMIDRLYNFSNINIYNLYISLLNGKIIPKIINKLNNLKFGKLDFLYSNKNGFLLNQKKIKGVEYLKEKNQEVKKPTSVSDIVAIKLFNKKSNFSNNIPKLKVL